jgi:hypothetical protein
MPGTTTYGSGQKKRPPEHVRAAFARRVSGLPEGQQVFVQTIRVSGRKCMRRAFVKRPVGGYRFE